jgi:hypothetical protein
MTPDHVVTMKYLIKKSVDDLVLLYHLPTELFYNSKQYKINDIRKEIIIINNKEIEFIRLYIEMIDSELYKHVGWVVNKTMHHCMICQNNLNDFFFRNHHCRICGNIICHRSTCNANYLPIKKMTKYGLQVICKACKPYNVSDYTYIYILYSDVDDDNFNDDP